MPTYHTHKKVKHTQNNKGDKRADTQTIGHTRDTVKASHASRPSPRTPTRTPCKPILTKMAHPGGFANAGVRFP